MLLKKSKQSFSLCHLSLLLLPVWTHREIHMMPLQTICSDASHPIPFIPLVVIEQAKKVVWDAA